MSEFNKSKMTNKRTRLQSAKPFKNTQLSKTREYPPSDEDSHTFSRKMEQDGSLVDFYKQKFNFKNNIPKVNNFLQRNKYP